MSTADPSARKRALLRELLAQEGIPLPAADAPRPGASGLSAPLTFSQERLWYLQQLVPDLAAYNIPLCFELDGDLNADIFSAAFADVTARHDLLRTKITSGGTAPRQEVDRSSRGGVTLQDLPGSDEQAIAAILSAEARLPFALDAAPLWRARLLRLSPRKHLFLFTAHHLIADGWSLAILLRQLGEAYAARLGDGTTGGRSAPRGERAPLQYADFAVWQRERAGSAETAAQLAYWSQQLSAPRANLELPADFPRPAVQSFEGDWLAHVLPPELAGGLHALARREGVTLLVVLLAAFNALLYRYTGETDITVGSPVTSRLSLGLEGVVGHFVNTLALRTRVESGMSFRALLGRARSAVLGALGNADAPLEMIIERLNIAREPSRNPLFQTALILQDAPAGQHWRSALALPGVQARQRFTHSGTAKFDLTLEVESLPEGLTVSAEFNTGLFREATIRRLLGHYQNILAAAAADPDTPVHRLGMLDAAEQAEIAALGRGPALEFPRERLAHQLFEARARAQPHALAGQFGGATLTYAELDARANRLAAALAAHGVAPEVIAGVCTDHSLDMLAANLAVLKAGGAYTPLDPDYPAERLRHILAATGAPVLLTQTPLLPLFADYGGTIINLSTFFDETSPSSPAPPAALTPDNLAYVIFTSGSTGKPKGVAVPHRGLLNLIHWHNAAFSVTPADRAAQIAALGFDAAVWETLPYLAAGASIHFPAPRETVLDPAALQRWLADERITLAFLPTPLAERVLPLARAGTPLRLLLTGGDVLHHYAPASLPFTLVNNYGPTENSVVTTSGGVPASGETARPSLGRVLPNQQVYLVDRDMNLVPVGVPGEILIGGDSLARGYLNQPGLSAAFMPNPFAPAGGRVYRTGDLARWLPSGEFDFLGRADAQVKVRGFRIELGEIEAALQEHPAVKSAAALVRETPGGDRRLAAYIIPCEPGASPAGELRAHLAARLPDYMIPAAFVFLDAFPLTPNGKIDRDALPAPAFGSRGAAGDFAPPRSETEVQIADIWREALEVGEVGLDDNFFDLGGNSLLLQQCHSRLQAGLGRHIPIIQFYMHPTIRALAGWFDNPGESGARQTDALARTAERAARRVNRRSP
jgi:amino acid adenylation domain-containing protein